MGFNGLSEWIPKSNSARYGRPQSSIDGQTYTGFGLNALGYPTFLPHKNLQNPGWIGRVAVQGGKVITIFAPPQYGGIMPLDKQPLINKPFPYNIPSVR